MNFHAPNPKITASHWSRLAVIYVRQSTVRQVTENTASAAFQYSLTGLARQSGWTDDLILVIDQDQGRSGTSTAGREGFKWLRQQIFEERVGAIICWDASRIARDSATLGHLIKLCAATNTLIIDVKGVYDPNNENDRIFLGLINVLVDAEGRRIIDKSITTIRMKAAAGELILMPPTGYVYDDDNKLIIDPDEQIQSSFRLLFSLYEKHGSLRQVVKEFNRKGIKFPTRKRGVGRNRPVTWGMLSVSRAAKVLYSPVYAGTYTYRRTKTIHELSDPDASEQTKKKIQLSLDDDEVILIHDAHEGYITWEKFKQNQQRLNNNRYSFSTGCSGAVRNGPALLQGIIKCGKCGSSMRVSYNYKDGKRQYYYICNTEFLQLGTSVCLSTVAPRLDNAVSEALLNALSPAQFRMTLQALEEIEEDVKVEEQQRLETLKRARAEADEARDRYDSIDPRNSLVAEMYERKLQEKLSLVKRLEVKRTRTSKTSSPQLRDEVRHILSTLVRVGDILLYKHASPTNA